MKIGFTGLLTILLIGLKLTHFIDWSYWWIFSPLWIPLIIIVILKTIVKMNESESNKAINNLKKSKFQEKLEKAMKDKKNGI